MDSNWVKQNEKHWVSNEELALGLLLGSADGFVLGEAEGTDDGEADGVPDGLMVQMMKKQIWTTIFFWIFFFSNFLHRRTIPCHSLLMMLMLL